MSFSYLRFLFVVFGGGNGLESCSLVLSGGALGTLKLFHSLVSILKILQKINPAILHRVRIIGNRRVINLWELKIVKIISMRSIISVGIG